MFMKKVLIFIVEFLLLVNLCFWLYLDILYIKNFILVGYYFNVIALLAIIGTITILAAMIMVVLLNFPAFQPLRDKLSARRQARQQAKAEKAEEKKQETIKALEDYLEELKKD